MKAALRSAGLLVALLMVGCGGANPPPPNETASRGRAGAGLDTPDAGGAPEALPAASPDAVVAIPDTVRAPDARPVAVDVVATVDAQTATDALRPVDSSPVQAPDLAPAAADAAPLADAQLPDLQPDVRAKPDVTPGEVPKGCTNEVTYEGPMDCWWAAALGACPHLVMPGRDPGTVAVDCRAACGLCGVTVTMPTGCTDRLGPDTVGSAVIQHDFVPTCAQWVETNRKHGACDSPGICDRSCGRCQ